MGYINREKSKGKMREKAHLNFMGGPSYDITNPLLRLRVAASSCFFGEPMYYHRDAKDKRKRKVVKAGALSSSQVQHLADTLNGIMPVEWRTMSPANLLESAIDAALKCDPEATLKLAVELRSAGKIRTTPQVILVRAANHAAVKGPKPAKGVTQESPRSRGLIRQYAEQIITRADEPAVCVAYHKQAFKGKGLPNSLKRALRDAFARFKPYHLAKYRMDGRIVSTRDVAHLVHPSGEKGSAVHDLRAGALRIKSKAKGGGGETWESITSREGKSRETWLKALDVMGHMALLRNLRNLHQAGIEPGLFVDKLRDGANTGKQLPFRYWSAYQALTDVSGVSPVLYDAIEDCIDASVGNLPQFKGKVMSLVDNSGSASNTMTSKMGTMAIRDIGNLMGVLTGMASDEGHLGVFGDSLKILPVRKRASVFHQLKEANSWTDRVGGGTEHGVWLFWRDAIKGKVSYDHVFIYSDMQAGHGGLYGTSSAGYPIWGGVGGHSYSHHAYIDVPKLISEYRSKVNPNVMVYLVQIAGYQDTLLPEWYDKTYILGGWSESILHFAAEMTSLQNMGQ
jgi:hypothetical protein